MVEIFMAVSLEMNRAGGRRGPMKNLSPPRPDKAPPLLSYLWCYRALTALFVIGAPCRGVLPGLNGLRYKLDGTPDKMRIFFFPCSLFEVWIGGSITFMIVPSG
ncbi:hypothetical protein CDAR_384381 [Caerostris darwini]|uniref:Uncharacterized protein n=1 Tax=Caerostris darwini TaxID=1538125 RepID=A0AAV4M5Z8_9ARAC|nr:hypothetical protein CDAR_384381 [Caerostris darwini]